MTQPAFDDETGIASIGLQLPPLAMDVRELATLRSVDPNKYSLGLGCGEMSLCPPGFDVVRLAAGAAKRALERWGGNIEDIGLLAVGTESAVDMSRPLSAWVASELGLRGDIRSYEVKHACYGGTLALRQGLEWRWSGAARGKAALIIAADVALYAEGDPGEPTQGAGAVAMVLDDPRVARIQRVSYPFSEPAFDFWRPVGESFPRVEGALSLECYERATAHCFGEWIGERDSEEALSGLAAACFHVPFPKMVKKAVRRLGATLAWDEAKTDAFFKSHVDPTMDWNRRCGNAYTAALWISVAKALVGLQPGQQISAFSYGSGFGAELQILQAGPDAAAGAWASDVEDDLSTRDIVSSEQYTALRA